MSKACPFTADQMIALVDKRPLFHAQQQVNDWHKSYGAEAVKAVQAELDRRRAKEAK
jgi:hypothetical protein